MMDPISIALGLAQFAPSLMKFFGVGEKPVAVAQKVIDMAQVVTGAKSPEEAMAAMRENAELASKFNLAVLAADTDLEKAYLEDRSDARARDVAIRAAGGHNIRADVMVAIDGIGLISCLLVLVFFRADIPGEATALISTIASLFGLCLRDAHQFEFGSSRGSQQKNELLALAPPTKR